MLNYPLRISMSRMQQLIAMNSNQTRFWFVRLGLFIVLFMVLLFLPVTTLLPQKAAAHPLDTGYSNVTIKHKIVNYELIIPETSLLKYDTNQDQQLSMEELNAQRSALADYIETHLQLSVQMEPLQFALVSIEKAAKTEIPCVQFNLSFSAKSDIERLDIRYDLLFDDDVPLHINFVLVENGKDIDQTVFDTINRSYHYEAMEQLTLFSSLGKYFILGVGHILTGYDHLLFLLSLLIIAKNLKEVVRIVTAFTIAHSGTLILTAIGHLSVPTQWVEPGIALTICYVAVENCFTRIKTVKFRWLLTFFFGLIHGMGFAGALSEVGLPMNYLISSLLSFNVGVEFGQLSIVFLILPFVLIMQRKFWYPRLVFGISTVIFVIALVWFVQRVGMIG